MHALMATCDQALGVGFAPLNATAKDEAFVRLDNLVEPLRKLAPDSGAYVNEVSFRAVRHG